MLKPIFCFLSDEASSRTLHWKQKGFWRDVYLSAVQSQFLSLWLWEVLPHVLIAVFSTSADWRSKSCVIYQVCLLPLINNKRDVKKSLLFKLEISSLAVCKKESVEKLTYAVPVLVSFSLWSVSILFRSQTDMWCFPLDILRMYFDLQFFKTC